MMYVQHDTLELKKQIESSKGFKPTHFIFGLDESGSMSGSCWNTLMSSMKQNIRMIVDSNRTKKNQLVSIFKFNTNVTPVFKF